MTEIWRWDVVGEVEAQRMRLSWMGSRVEKSIFEGKVVTAVEVDLVRSRESKELGVCASREPLPLVSMFWSSSSKAKGSGLLGRSFGAPARVSSDTK